MKNALLCSLLLLLFADCGTPDPPSALPQRILIIGTDNSRSFQGDSLDAGCLRTAGAFVAETGGIVAFRTIGNPTQRSLLPLMLKPPPALGTAPTYDELQRWRRDTALVNQHNNEHTEEFLQQCLGLLAQRDQDYSDINGFFQKSAELLNEAGLENYDAYVWLHTDGLHDIVRPGHRRDTTVRCALLPERAMVITSGWRNNYHRPPHWATMASPHSLSHVLHSLSKR